MKFLNFPFLAQNKSSSLVTQKKETEKARKRVETITWNVLSESLGAKRSINAYAYALEALRLIATVAH